MRLHLKGSKEAIRDRNAFSLKAAEEPQDSKCNKAGNLQGHTTTHFGGSSGPSTSQRAHAAVWSKPLDNTTVHSSTRVNITESSSISGKLQEDVNERDTSVQASESNQSQSDHSKAMPEKMLGKEVSTVDTVETAELQKSWSNSEDCSHDAVEVPCSPRIAKYTEAAENSGTARQSAFEDNLLQNRSANQLSHPSTPPDSDAARHATEGARRLSKSLTLLEDPEAFKGQEWQLDDSFEGPLTEEAFSSLGDCSTAEEAAAAQDTIDRLASIDENATSIATEAWEGDQQAYEEDLYGFVTGLQAAKKALQGQPDRSSLEITVLHEAKPDHSSEQLQEAPFTSHIDKDVLDDPDPEEMMSQRDFKRLATEPSLTPQVFGSSQSSETLQGHQSMGRDTAKLSETARRRGKARLPRFAFPKQAEPSAIRSTSNVEEAEAIEPLSNSSQVMILS